MRHRALFLPLLFAALGAGAEMAPSYLLSEPTVPIICNSTNSTDNAWLASNAVMTVQSGFWSQSCDTNTYELGRSDDPSQKAYTLADCEAGYSAERSKPEYYLGDTLNPPDNVDWTATYDRFQERTDIQANFVFDSAAQCVFVGRGTTSTFDWVINSGSGLVTNTVTVVASPVTSERPKNIFWTDAKWGGRTIDLSDKFVSFFGPSNLLTKVTSKVATGTEVNGQMSYRDEVTSGLYIDESVGGKRILYAAGELEGQVLMVYYATGNRQEIVGTQVVQISRPSVEVVSATVGSELKPTGRGYTGAKLVASPSTLDDFDEKGPFLYQYTCEDTLSKYYQSVFAIRPSEQSTRNQTQIYWMETDDQGVQWPFEVDEYLVSWPSEMPVFVRGEDPSNPGKGMTIPDKYTVELMKYQEDTGSVSPHAEDPDDNVFITTGPGCSLLKLTDGDDDDDLWFMPVRSVLRTDKTWFTLASDDYAVGEELVVRSGSLSGLAEGRTIEVDDSLSGWIYEPVSTPCWNAALYSADGTGSTGYPSVIYPVTAPLDNSTASVEVWWMGGFKHEGMTEEVTYPTLPQVYDIAWPTSGENYPIVIASQQGSAAANVCSYGSALGFAGTNSIVNLGTRRYFGSEGGSISFWTKVYDDSAKGKSSYLASFTSTTNSNYGVWLSVDQSGRVSASVVSSSGTKKLVVMNITVDSWAYVTFWWNAERAYLSVSDGKTTCTANDSSSFRVDFAVPMIGRLGDPNTTAVDRMLDEVVCTDGSVSFNQVRNWAYNPPDVNEVDGITLSVDFEGEDDLAYSSTNERTVRDAVSGDKLTATDCLCWGPGAPRLQRGLIQSDTEPQVYRQTDKTACGYNPNEEHAFIEKGGSGYVVWALRSDLNTYRGTTTSRPGVLVSYTQDGEAKMRWFDVMITNRTYTTLADTCVAGNQFPGPKPFNLMDTPWMKEDYWQDVNGQPQPAYRDRKGQVWARCAGASDIYMYYANKATYDWPDGLSYKVGASVPWLTYANLHGDNNGKPEPWHWTVTWPENLAEMKIGQTVTEATDGIAEVWGAKAIAILYPSVLDQATTGDPDETVLLTDPTVAQTADLGRTGSELVSYLSGIGLKTGTGEKLTLRKGKYYFNDLKPSLSERIYVDASNGKLYVVGEMEDNTGGVNLLHINVLSAAEREELRHITEAAVKDSTWMNAVNGLAKKVVKPTTVANTLNETTGLNELVCTYTAPDHYALTAMGRTNYVTVIENDATNSFCDAGNPISMHLYKVIPKYDTGRVVTREDPQNLLSQKLSIHYSGTFAGQADDFIFEWAKKLPESDGSVPYDFGNYDVTGDTAGLTSFVVGGQGDTLANMVNTYWTCRYKAANTSSPAYRVMGDQWSDWSTPPALAEGWVQRVLNNITPFTQRMTDLYENEAETAVSMIRQAGAPYEGDVALNQDNLTSVGLIQLYRTILSKAESLSLLMKEDNKDANDQLLLAVERLADLYKVLGDEAYADALNPTIGFGSNFTEVESGLTIDYGAASSSLFCFDNQVPTLLDEELALLRGRSCVNAPKNTVGPYYNRLVWNFTKGITAGEVAYAVNYDISGTKSSTITASTAAEMYPQGHGDAYGHYLSALQGYYRLIRNPYFSWGVGMGALNVADNAVNVDYYDEATFAQAAADVAKTARRTVELTALKAYRDNGEDSSGSGYIDSNITNSFGYGEWASRGGYGALCNWAVANALLPECETTNEMGVAYKDKGLLRIDRGTVTGIGELTEAVAAIQRTTDRMDSGLNPLGLNENAIPFDVTPLGSASDKTQFEQVRERAQTAYENAEKILDKAQTYANHVRLLSESESGITDQLDSMESDYKAQLIAIYGRPYSDDIGPGKTYEQGYDGPDYYHYMWMNLADYGLTSVEDTMAVQTVTYQVADGVITNTVKSFSSAGVTSTEGTSITYALSANGVVVKPSSISGTRPASGKLQLAYADFLSAYANAQQKLKLYQIAVDTCKQNTDLLDAQMKARATMSEKVTALRSQLDEYYEAVRDCQIASATLAVGISECSFNVDTAGKVAGNFGLATTAAGDTFKTISGGIFGVIKWLLEAGKLATDIVTYCYQYDINEANLNISRASGAYDAVKDKVSMWQSATEAANAVNEAASELSAAFTALASAQEQVSALVSEADEIRDARELARQQAVNNIAKMRYNDMFFRKLTNESLTQYETAFDLARRYTFLAAKAYGYETGCGFESSETGSQYLRSIIGARQLGGENGLEGILAKMDANWSVAKTQLGINNPQNYATWFSLRHGLFRILTDETGDAAWKTELAKYWVEDIRTNAEFKRYCQPFASQFGTADKEPGLVIPFETTIDFAYNLFGKPLAFDDAQFDSTYYATKIAAAGVWFEGYNEKRDGYRGSTAFATTPNVYLVPVGTDRMRVPGSDGAEIADFNVVDQTIAVPYPFTSSEIAEANWLPSYLDGDLGGADSETRIRRHPSFRAYYGNRGDSPDTAQLDAVRLTGRSVWNTRWLLVIPAGTLNADRDAALKAFINGLDTNRDGVIDVLPVNDIRIGFKTYANGGK